MTFTEGPLITGPHPPALHTQLKGGGAWGGDSQRTAGLVVNSGVMGGVVRGGGGLGQGGPGKGWV